MAASRSKILSQLTHAEVQALMDTLAALPAEERTGAKLQALVQQQHGIDAGLNAAYTVLNGEFARHLERLNAMRARAEFIAAHAANGTMPDNSFVADANSALLSDLVNEHLVQVELDLADPKHLERFTALVEANAKLRAGDRALAKTNMELKVKNHQLEKLASETREDLQNPELSEDQRAARMRARFGV